MASTHSEISLLKLVLADYLQVLELHLFAILQMQKTLMWSAARGYFSPGNAGCRGEPAHLLEGGARVSGWEA